MTVELQKPDAIFFDWDGTLVDSFHALRTYYNHVLSVFEKPEITDEQAKSNIRRSAREVFPETFGAQSEEALKVFYSYVADHHIDHLKPFTDSQNFIDGLSGFGIPLGIVSNKKHSFLIKEIAHLGWDKYLVSNIGAGVAAKDKPEPDPLVMAIEKIGLSPAKNVIWYVGDTETDIQAAIASGCQPIFIEHGLGVREDCQKHGLNPFFVKNLPELADLVQKFF